MKSSVPQFVVLLTAGVASAGCVEHERHFARRREVVEPAPVVVRERVPAPAPAVVVEERRFEPAPAVAITTYETDLSPYGRWVEVSTYGRCWVPNGRPAGWRPYTVGHWVNTDDGWCWASDADEADWGVVTYHYGSWYEDPSYGWVWVPGTTWSPAWVAWREGGGYCGWAPLPPTVVVRDRVDAVYVDRYVPADRFVFVQTSYIGEPAVYRHIERNNVTIVNRTTNITNITIESNRVVNRGVAVTDVERSSGRRIETVHVQRAASAAEARRMRTAGRPVAYVPETVRKADTEYRERITRRTTDIRRTDGTPAIRRDQQNAAERVPTERRVNNSPAARERIDRRAPDAVQAKERANRRANEGVVEEKERANPRKEEGAREERIERRDRESDHGEERDRR